LTAAADASVGGQTSGHASAGFSTASFRSAGADVAVASVGAFVAGWGMKMKKRAAEVGRAVVDSDD
jgi:hypothetical protein